MRSRGGGRGCCACGWRRRPSRERRTSRWCASWRHHSACRGGTWSWWPGTRGRFVRGGRALAQVHHRNIVQIFDAGEADGAVYLAMEIVEGPSLAEMLGDDGPLPLHDVVRIVDEVAGALAAVHARGLV